MISSAVTLALEFPRQSIFSGVMQGLTYGVIAIGLILIYRSTQIINFAIVEMGAFAAALLARLVINWGVDYWVALPACVIAGGYAIHALTVGAIGGLTLGMMTRTARGHTGRPLRADGFELVVFLLIQIAAIVRVFGGIVAPVLYLASVQLSALLWAAAFALYAVRYWPILSRVRLDGKPG